MFWKICILSSKRNQKAKKLIEKLCISRASNVMGLFVSFYFILFGWSILPKHTIWKGHGVVKKDVLFVNDIKGYKNT